MYAMMFYLQIKLWINYFLSFCQLNCDITLHMHNSTTHFPFKVEPRTSQNRRGLQANLLATLVRVFPKTMTASWLLNWFGNRGWSFGNLSIRDLHLGLDGQHSHFYLRSCHIDQGSVKTQISLFSILFLKIMPNPSCPKNYSILPGILVIFSSWI